MRWVLSSEDDGGVWRKCRVLGVQGARMMRGGWRVNADVGRGGRCDRM